MVLKAFSELFFSRKTGEYRMKILLCFLLATSLLCGATVDFRSGKILNAEISSVKPRVLNFNPKAFTDLPENPLYAAVTVSFDDGRHLSIHDYGLEASKVYHCIAIRTGSKPFDGNYKGEITVSPKEKYTLLFVIDTAAGLNDESSMTLKALCKPQNCTYPSIIFINKRSKPFTEPKDIPFSGKMTVKK